MAGIYIHIPFCYKRCSYCDFYKTTDQQFKGEYIKALCKEIDLHRSFFQKTAIRTLYFGGGTPSTLSVDNYKTVFNSLFAHFDCFQLDELTIEMNPDDVTQSYVEDLMKMGMNRISLGIQSFEDEHLRLMNRRHNAAQAKEAVRTAQQSGIENMSIDLIYGLPYMSFEQWQNNVQQAIDMGIQHISAYHLTYEKGTLYHDYLQKGKFKEIPDEESVRQFNYLVEQLKLAGFDHYEISNFAKPGFYSQHNSSYWKGDHYLGLGPSAHSFDGKTRRWNVSNLKQYCNALDNDGSFYETEQLSQIDLYNEAIMIGLRTAQGVSVDYLKSICNDQLWSFYQQELSRQEQNGNVEVIDGYSRVCEAKRFITDRIISDMFFVDDDE